MGCGFGGPEAALQGPRPLWSLEPRALLHMLEHREAQGLARKASSTVAPRGNTHCHSSTERGALAWTMLTRISAINLFSAFDKSIDEAAGNLVEYGPHQGGERRVVKTVVQTQSHPAGALRRGGCTRLPTTLPLRGTNR